MKSDFSPEMLLANGFADQLAFWADECQASPSARELLRRAGRAVSLATSDGHVCVMLSDIVPPSSAHSELEMRELLLSSGVVGTPRAPGAMPLILDDEGRVYLHRYFNYERRLSKRLLAASEGLTPTSITPQRLQLDALFGVSLEADGANWQKIAVALAMRQRLAIISGGPGTGKTTTVVNLLACILEQSPDCRIALAAPTGKAAARMQDAIRRHAHHLSPSQQERLPQESFTVHRLLGVSSHAGRFKHHAENPLPIDALVVDEASMLDIALATQLLDAVPVNARIILLGDMNQLSAVQAGSVFSEISADPSLSQDCIQYLSESTGIASQAITPDLARKQTSLHNSVVWLSKSFRFSQDSGIGKLAHHINAGKSKETLEWLVAQSESSVEWVQDNDTGLSASTQTLLQNGYAPYLSAVRSNPRDVQAVFESFDRYRILCAIREGGRGVVESNRLISRWFHDNEHATWFIGRPIIILHNDYVLKLFNGDVGIVLPDESGDTNNLAVYFQDGPNRFRALATSRLPEHETAFAMTVHKAQGSEFDSVCMLLPSSHSKVVSRELIYTGVTRARDNVTIVSSAEVLEQAITTATQRNSGLLRRVEEAYVKK